MKRSFERFLVHKNKSESKIYTFGLGIRQFIAKRSKSPSANLCNIKSIGSIATRDSEPSLLSTDLDPHKELRFSHVGDPAPSKKGPAPWSRFYKFLAPAPSKKAWLLGAILEVFNGSGSLYEGLASWRRFFLLPAPSKKALLYNTGF